MGLFPTRLLLVLSVSIFLTGKSEADPLIAFSNIPPPSSYKPGGSNLFTGSSKAILFTTPPSSETEITSIKVGLTYCPQSGCPPRAADATPNYPSQADFQISLFSTVNQAGVQTPDSELYSIPMQNGLTLNGEGTEFTFSIPSWRLAKNTTYALVGRSTNSNPVKWSNIKLGCAECNYPPQAQNGFSFNSTQAFLTDPTSLTPSAWLSAGTATNNSVEMKFNFVSSGGAPVPTLSEWAQIILGFMTMTAMGWHFHNHKKV